MSGCPPLLAGRLSPVAARKVASGWLSSSLTNAPKRHLKRIVQRLRRSADFSRIQSGGVRLRGKLLHLMWAPAEAELPRCGFAVSKAVGNAVARNRVKRWLREATRERVPARAADLVFSARPGSAQSDYGTISIEVVRLLELVR